MSYGSINGVKDNLPKLRKYIKADNDPDVSDLDIKHSTIERILAEISDHVNAALSQRYVVPFVENIPAVVHSIVNDLTAFKISRSYQTTISAEENQNVMAMRKDAKEILMSIVSGEYELTGVTVKDLESEITQLLRSGAEEFFDLEDVVTWQDKI